MPASVEELAYEEALREIQGGFPRHGIWIKALAHSDGDETKARAAYLRFRAEQIVEESSAASMEVPKRTGRMFAQKAWTSIKRLIRWIGFFALVLFFISVVIAAIVLITK